ncbi:hypothetical protein AGMMS50268_21130 [Spirochaetia bacterium]|nr:hypothetical protein AGMMS50268_21130 [Spirochaetia bacterium]
MANHASLLDVWNAGTRLVSQGLDMYTGEKKYELDTKAFKEAVGDPESGIEGLATLQNNLALAYMDPAAGAAYREDPKSYQTYVASELQKWKDNAIKRGNNSRYYNDKINQMYGRAYEGTLEKAVQAEIQTRDLRVNQTFESSATRAINTAPPGQARAAVQNQIELARINDVNINPAILKQWETNGLKMDFNSALAYTPSPGVTKAEIDKKYEDLSKVDDFAVLSDFKSDIESANKAAIATQEALNFGEIKQKYADYENKMDLYRDAVKKGNYADIDRYYREADRLAIDGAREQELARGKNKGEYSAGNLSQITLWSFIRPDKNASEILEEDANRAAGAARQAIPAYKIGIESAVTATLAELGQTGIANSIGNGPNRGTNMSSAIDRLVQDYGKEYGGDREDEDIYRDFNHELMRQILDKNNFGPGVEEIRAIMKIENSVMENIKKRTGLETGDIERELTHGLVNLMADTALMGDMSPEGKTEKVRRLTELKTQYVGSWLNQGLKADNKNTSQASFSNRTSDSEISKFMYVQEQNPDITTRDAITGGIFTPSSFNDNVNFAWERQKSILHNQLGFDENNISKTPNENDKFTATVEGRTFQLKGSRNGEMFLEEYKDDKWTIVAKKVRNNEWNETDSNGKEILKDRPYTNYFGSGTTKSIVPFKAGR